MSLKNIYVLSNCLSTAYFSPTNKVYFLSNPVHDEDPNATGLNLALFLLRSKMHYLVSHKILNAHCGSQLSAGCIWIHPMASFPLSVFRKTFSPVSNIANTGEYVTPFFNQLDSYINTGVQDINVIGFLKNLLGVFVVASCVFQIMNHICGRNLLIQ